MARVAGICFVKVDGLQLELSGSMEAPLSDMKREPVLSTSGFVGTKDEKIAPYVKGTFVFTSDFPTSKLVDGTAMTITAEFANGKVYTLSDASLMGDTPVAGDDGTVALEFAGKKGVWQ